MKNIENKVIVITGASSGIGEATAKLLAENGAKVVLCARNEQKLQDLVAAIGADRAAYIVADVTKLDDMKALADFAVKKFDRIDVLYANAGIMPVGNLSELKVDEWEATIDTNINGVLYSLAAVLPIFRKQNVGQLVVTCSDAGLHPVPGNAVYCGTKYFLRGLIDSFRSEAVAEGDHIRTTMVYPGAINTNLLSTIDDAKTRVQVAAVYKQVAMGPQAIAEAVMYAISCPEDVDVSDIVVRSSRQG